MQCPDQGFERNRRRIRERFFGFTVRGCQVLVSVSGCRNPGSGSGSRFGGGKFMRHFSLTRVEGSGVEFKNCDFCFRIFRYMELVFRYLRQMDWGLGFRVKDRKPWFKGSLSRM